MCIRDRIDGKRVLVGNTRLLSKYSIEFPKAVFSITETTVVCAVGDKYIGCIILSDVLKDDASDTVKALKELNIKNIQILSGDKQSIVTIFANKLGITQAYGDLLPEGKVEHIERLKEEKGNQIAFVGDGMNDAPVLALSDVGIAMGGLGSDAAIETADVVIQTDQPSKVATAIKVGRCTRRIIWQNVLLAFGVKLLVLILGASGIATLWEAVFADVGVTLIAIMNAVRIQKMETEQAVSLLDLENKLDTVDKSTIFRTITLFVSHHLAHSVDDGTGSLKYAVCDSECTCAVKDLHTHFYCEYCHKTFCLENIHVPVVDLPEGFAVRSINYVLKGCCAECAVELKKDH